jgi:hypothetical protein
MGSFQGVLTPFDGTSAKRGENPLPLQHFA